MGFRAAHFEWLLLYFERALDEDAFIRFGNEMLDGVAAFWEGLNEDRLALVRQA